MERNVVHHIFLRISHLRWLPEAFVALVGTGGAVDAPAGSRRSSPGVEFDGNSGGGCRRANGESSFWGDECTSNSLASSTPVRQLSLLRLLQLCSALSLDPRPVRRAMLNQEGLRLCPAPDPRSVRAPRSQITGLGVRRFLGDGASLDAPILLIFFT